MGDVSQGDIGDVGAADLQTLQVPQAALGVGSRPRVFWRREDLPYCVVVEPANKAQVEGVQLRAHAGVKSENGLNGDAFKAQDLHAGNPGDYPQ